ncbi:MAG: UPF0182 family protein [Nitrospirota bacterium]|nr:UPF0182 family protein [Nitrospirota bacterium]
MSLQTPPGVPNPMHTLRNLLLLVTGFVLLLSMSALVGLYVEWLWFREVRFADVFRTILSTRVSLGAGAALVCFGILYVNLRHAAAFPKEHLLRMMQQEGSRLPVREVLDRYLGPAVVAACAVMALLSGVKASAGWQDFMLYAHGVPFGRVDPQLGKDLGFYVFQLPFVHWAQAWLLGNLLLAMMVSAAVYFVLGGILFTPVGPVLDQRVCRHLGLIGAAVIVVMGAGFYLQIFDSLFTRHGVVTGASYADVYARIPAYKLLAAVSVGVAGVVAFFSWRGQWKLPLLAVGGLLLLSFVGGGVLPGMLQKYQVVPNEIVKESLFIDRNIAATRDGFGLTNVSAEEFPAADSLTAQSLANNRATIENVRLWDHKPLLSTYRQLQQIRTYYDFVDVDNDRYTIDGEVRQVMLSPRELSFGNLPGGANWINEHLTYTHGYGVSVGPVNRISPEGLPEFFVKDIPPVSSTQSLQVTRPEIYYGEAANEYVFVRTQAKEFDFPVGDQNQYATYAGKGGVPIGGGLRKLIYSYHFRNTKLLFSSDIVAESRIMYHREIRDRAAMVAPYLLWDQDPYMVIREDGSLVWLLDGYTVTRRLPYSEPMGGHNGFNYIRNSVKAVVDAYHGSVTLYMADASDPIIRTWASVFPETLLPLETMPSDIRAHLRYPQDLFSVQAGMLQKYHMLGSQNFYNNEDLWEIPRQGDSAAAPYYTIMKLPGEKEEEFILLLPYTPSRRDNMTAWLAARSDGENYGKLVVYLFPKQKLIYGPRQIEARIDQDAQISEQLTLWSQMGSTVIRGTLLVIPIEDSLLYIEPLYLAAEKGSLPELRRVIVSYGNRMAMEPNLELALGRIFGKGVPESRPVGRPGEVQAPQKLRTLKDMALDAQRAFEAAQHAQRGGNWSEYGERLRDLEAVLREMGR